jgi:uncharacterized membrane protein YuzA (DUF378 family)
MIRGLFIVFVLLLVVALVIGAHRLRQVLYVLLGLMAVYALLKTTGVIEAWAPSRTGWW